MPDHSVVHRYARCLSYPEWGVGSVTGIYFTGSGDDVQQWARVKFSPGVRTVPAGSLQFVDFSKPDPGAERVQRFMTAAQHAMAEGDYPLAAKRLIFARDAEPTNAAVLRLMTLAFWQAGELSAAGRAVRDWARVEGDRPAPHRFAARIYEDMGAIDLAAEAADRAAARGPQDADAWERVGACACGSWTARRPSPRSRWRAVSAPASRACSTSRSPTISPATSARRSPPPSRRRCWSPPPLPPGRATRTRSRAPTASPMRSRRPSARSSSTARTARSPTSSSACARRYRACARGVIAWAFDRAALGAPPDGVELAAELGPEVEFAVVALGGPAAPSMGLSGLRVLQTALGGRGLDHRPRARG